MMSDRIHGGAAGSPTGSSMPQLYSWGPPLGLVDGRAGLGYIGIPQYCESWRRKLNRLRKPYPTQALDLWVSRLPWQAWECLPYMRTGPALCPAEELPNWRTRGGRWVCCPRTAWSICSSGESTFPHPLAGRLPAGSVACSCGKKMQTIAVGEYTSEH